MRRGRAGAGAAGAQQKSAVERDLWTALSSLRAGQALQKHLVDRLSCSRDEMRNMAQSPENNAAALAVLGWAAREATRVAQTQQEPQQRQGPRSGASEEELSRLLQLVSSVLTPMAWLTDTNSSPELGQAVARTQLPQALASLLTALFPPGFRCCGGSGGASGNSRSGGSSSSGGSGSTSVGSAGIRMRLDLLMYVAAVTSNLWAAGAHRVPELVTCLRESQLLERIAAALLRAQAAECGQQQQRSGGAGAAVTAGSHRSGGNGSCCYVAWLRSAKQAKELWPVLRNILHNLITVNTPIMSPRTWVLSSGLQDIAGDLPQCRETLSAPAVQLWLGRTLVAATNRCLAEADEGEEEGEEEAGQAAGGSAADSSGAAAVLTRDVQLQQRWFGLPESLRPGGLPLARERMNTAEMLMDVVESVGSVWDFTVSGLRLPRLGQQPPQIFFKGHPAGEAMRKVIGGVGTPAEAAAVAAAEAQLPPLHPPSYTAVQVYEMTHAALTVALDHASAEAVCLHAPLLLARLVMELPPRQAAARLPGLWCTLSRVLPRLACGGAGNRRATFGMMSQGPYWQEFRECRSEVTSLYSFYLSMLLQLKLQLPSAGSGALAASGAGPAADAATAVGGAGPGPGPGFSLRCALGGGLLPAIEALLRRLCRTTAAQATAGPSEAAGFMDAAQQASYTVHILLRCSGVWPAVLAHGPPQQVASLVRTMGKALAAVGDTYAALQQRPQLLGAATQMVRAAMGNPVGQANFPAALAALLEQASIMLDQGMVFHGLRGLDAAVAAAVADQHRQARNMSINDTMATEPMTLDIDWVAAVGGCPSADTAAARQQQALAGWALLQWMPELLRQAESDAPAAVNRVYAVSHVQDMAIRALWPVMREHLLASEGTASASATASCPADATANAAGWRHFLLNDLNALGWTERLLARVANATPTADDMCKWAWLVRLGLSLLAVSELPGGPEACDAAASAGGCKSAAVSSSSSSSAVAATSGQLQAGGVAGVNSTSRRQERRQERRQQQQRMLQHLHRVSRHIDGEWAATIGSVELSLQAVWEQAEAVGLHPSDTAAAAGGGAALAAAPAATAVNPPPPVYKVPERLLTGLAAAVGDHFVMLWGGVPLVPGAEQLAALLGETGLVLCGNPTCSSLDGDSEAGLMAAGAAAGQQRGGRGGAAGGGGRIKTCSRCSAVRYCSGACQLQHWTTGGHKEACAGAAGGSGGAGGGSTAGR
ncbi:hypothetical protein CHLRE_06g262350v5 [Chlamydomonas reinhardtii]|uniref:phytol kinase n=1 Tax=Chlamydomonas reinhardtii TaxID=3055 RepID=A0A2K3DMR5_CHLRE|nr:uncharacterized protein CHLRE_06g262350v5 [Chlamydomonas reinhardtii]PNW81834.1 hypothetical protein CHLRE_06g262350v5 [Chlamydomonas reinhardtii]